MKPIYLDYAATTPVDARVAKKMWECLTLTGAFGNPASLHDYGLKARQLVEVAREQVAALFHAHPEEIIWTSGATESNNLAIKGSVQLKKRKGNHVITMKTEHKAVLDPCQYLEKQGYSVTYLAPKTNGLLDLDTLQAAIREDTVLISIMHVNNEIGTLQAIDAIADITAAQDILFHVDAAQSAGKVNIDLTKTPIDLLSSCAHKIYGPKGVGALYLRKKPRVRVEALIHGGGHEQGMRSGTLASHQIVGMGEAFSLAKQEMQQNFEHIMNLRDRFLGGLQSIDHLAINSDLQHCVPHIVNCRFEGMLAQALLSSLPQLAVSTSSACQGSTLEGSYVLRAMGLSAEHIKSSVRFSFGQFTTSEDVDAASKAIVDAICRT